MNRFLILTFILRAHLGAGQSEFPDSQSTLRDTVALNQLIHQSRKEQWMDPEQSLRHAEEALAHSRQLNYVKGMASAQNLKGFCFWTFGDNDQAIEAALASIDLTREDELPVIQGESYYILSRAYMDMGESTRAWESIRRAESLVGENDWPLLCSIYNLKGVILYIERKQDSALYFYQKAYDVGKVHDIEPINFPRMISNIAECYLDDQPRVAFTYFDEALALAKETGNTIAEASICGIMGRAYLRAHNLSRAESLLQHSLALAKELGLRRVIRHAYSGLVDIRLQQGNSDEAIHYLRNYYAVNDSLLNSSKVRQIVELESKHELELKEKNIQLLKQEKEIQTLWRNLLIGLVVLLIVLSVGLLRFQQYRYRKNREMLDLEIDFLTRQHEEAVNKSKVWIVPEGAESIESYDQKLLRQAIAIVEDHLDDPQLSVERMASEMNMSRTSLHRKIKSITGFPPSELIRSIRLRKAAGLILNKVDTVSQIALRVGFDDYSHFSKSFKKQFGVPPTNYEEHYHAMRE